MCLSFRKTDLPYQISPAPARSNRMPTINSARLRVSIYSCSSHAPHPNAISIDSAINTIWNAFSDILPYLHNAAVGHRQQRKIHQSGKKEDGGGQDRVNHLFFRKQVHEKADHQESLRTGDNQRDDNV